MPSYDSIWKDVYKRRFICEKDLRRMINAIIKRSFKKDCLENKDLAKFGEYCDKKDAEDIVQIENVLYGIMNAVRYCCLNLLLFVELNDLL